ncbi:hypothetical protein GCM10026986_11950 [Nitrincola alkalisediminis]
MELSILGIAGRIDLNSVDFIHGGTSEQFNWMQNTLAYLSISGINKLIFIGTDEGLARVTFSFALSLSTSRGLVV